MDLGYPEGATPIDPDEAEGLRLTHITTREQLNIFEQENIRAGMAWAWRARPKELVSVDFMRRLHRQMFGHVWRWAGEFRRSNKNIGVPRENIGVELHKLCRDAAHWIGHGTYAPDEIAARFHHRLVAIHAFANGNGRHARLITDLLLEKRLDRPRFTWGRADLERTGEARQRYIAALQAADKGDYAPLLAFVRS